MIGILIGSLARMLNSPIISPSSLILLILVVVFVIAAIVHPREFKCLIPGVLYFITLPSAFILLNIYAVINLNNVSWGTREIKPLNTESSDKKNKFLKLISSFLGRNVDEKNNLDLLEKLIPALPQKNESEVDKTEVKNWTEHVCLKKSDTEILDENETKFFEQLIEKYLYPNLNENANKAQMIENLKDLRNTSSYYFLLLNSSWIILLFTLQLLKDKLLDKIYIQISIFNTMTKYEPVYFTYVLIFVIVLLTQFLAMIWHRTITFIQVIRKTSLRCSRPSKKENKTKETIENGHVNATFENSGTGIQNNATHSVLDL